MWLINTTLVRVKEYKKGWVVECQFKTWYGRRYWKHIISPHGLPNEPRHFSTKESALEQAVKYFGWEILENSNETSP
jgi:hypothetical protein